MGIEVTREELYHHALVTASGARRRRLWHLERRLEEALQGGTACRFQAVAIGPERRPARRSIRHRHLAPASASGPIVIRGSRLPGLPDHVERRNCAPVRGTQPENRVEVSATPAELHPAVAATWDALDAAEAERKRARCPSRIGGSLTSMSRRCTVPRAMLFLNALVTAAESAGYRLEQRGRSSVLRGRRPGR
jgi:hypothetical protein